MFAANREELRQMVLTTAQEMKPQLSPKKVKGDGNCFFRSVADLLGAYIKPKATHENVRSGIIKEVLSRPDLYSDFVPGNDVKAWAKTQSINGEFNDNLCPKVIANMFAPIVIWRKMLPKQEPVVFVADEPSFEDDNPPLYLELDETSPGGGEHYNPLVVKDELPELAVSEETGGSLVERAECEERGDDDQADATELVPDAEIEAERDWDDSDDEMPELAVSGQQQLEQSRT